MYEIKKWDRINEVVERIPDPAEASATRATLVELARGMPILAETMVQQIERKLEPQPEQNSEDSLTSPEPVVTSELFHTYTFKT